MRNRLIELLDEARNKWLFVDKYNEAVADHLLASGVIASPCDTVWFIADKNTKYAIAMPRQTKELPLYMLSDLKKYGYYRTKEEAEQAIEKDGKVY